MANNNQDRNVPNPKHFMMLDPTIQIVQARIPGAAEVRQIPLINELGTCQVIQPGDNDGQGYYLRIDSGRFGTSLVKYFMNITYIPSLWKMYSGLALSPEVAQAHRQVEQEKNTEREIVFARQVVHPHITKILAFISPTGDMKGINAVIMEGFSLGTLEIYARREQLPDHIIKKYAYQLADALRYCHDALNIIHRDVRPRNIYVHGDGGTIKIGNFGYARLNNEEYMTADKGDEIYYKAPESIDYFPVAKYSYPVDVYSYGLVLWSISHQGSVPFVEMFQGSDEPDQYEHREFLEESNDNRPAIREDLDSDLTATIRKCWVNLENGLNTRPTMEEVATIFTRAS